MNEPFINSIYNKIGHLYYKTYILSQTYRINDPFNGTEQLTTGIYNDIFYHTEIK